MHTNIKTNDELIQIVRHAAYEAFEHFRKENVSDQEYLHTKQASTYLGLSKQQLEIWRCYGGGPSYIKLAQAVRYKKSELDNFMAAHSRTNTSEGGCSDF